MLRSHSNRLGKACELVNFKRKTFCWKRLALCDVGIGPQQNLKKPHKECQSSMFHYALGQLQAILHHVQIDHCI